MLTLENALFSDESRERPQLEVECRRFTPVSGDPLDNTRTRDGEKIDVAFTPHPMTGSQLIKTASKLLLYVDGHLLQILEELRVGWDDIVSAIIAEAVRKAEHSRVLQNGLEVAVLTRLALKGFGIAGDEKLQIAQVGDPESPYLRRFPVPPVLEAQIQDLWMKKMRVLRLKVRSGLRALIEH